MAMPKIRKGENELIIRAPIGKRISLENFFLLGDFGVLCEGCETSIIASPEKIPFGDITRYGMPFYGANVTYKMPIEVDTDCDIDVRVSHYIGALVRVGIDGKDQGRVVFAPFKLRLNDVKAGKHEITFKDISQNLSAHSWV